MKNAVRVIIIGIMAAALIVSYYFYLTRHTGSRTEETKEVVSDEMTKVTTRDFVKDYPATPREVIKWYNRIIALYYSPTTTEEQLVALTSQAKTLMDDELLERNPSDVYDASVRLDINDFNAHDRTIVTTDVCDTNDVIYKRVDGDDLAYVIGYYFIKEGSNYTSSYQKYVLRKDDAGNYKILGFELCDKDGDPIR